MRRTIADWILIALSIVVLVATGVYLIIAWGSIPDKIPTNFDFSGKVTSYGGKDNIIFAFLMDVFVSGTLLLCAAFPKSWNVPGKAKNNPETYIAVKYMLESMAFLLALFLGYLLYTMAKLIALKSAVIIVFIVILAIGSIAPFVIPKLK